MKKTAVMAAVILFIISIMTVGVSASDNPDKFWGDDFERYSIGDVPEAFSDFYNSSAQKRHNDWTSVTQGVTVVRESDDIDNKAVEFKNTAADSQDIGLSKFTGIGVTDGNPDFDITFKVKPNKNNMYVNLQQYGGRGGSYRVFNINGSGLYFLNTYLSEIETDKWHSVKISIRATDKQAVIYLDGEKMYYGPFGDDAATGYYVHFRSVLSSGSSAYWDDFAFTNNIRTDNDNSSSNNLDKYRGVHPRLFYDADDFTKMSSKLKNNPKDYAAWIKNADEIAAAGPTEYYVDSNEEELWMRGIGDNIRFLSLVYKLTGDTKYKDAAAKIVDSAISYPQWGRGNAYLNKNLACSHMLVGISCYYDWLYDELDENQRYKIKNIIIERAGTLSGGAWWTRSYTMNHCWNGASGSLVSAMAVYDEYPEALKWANAAHGWYRSIFEYLGDDGACHEGMMYWDYGMIFMRYYLELAPKFYNIDYSGHGYVQNTAKYAEAMILPGNQFSVIRFSDFRANFSASAIGNIAFLNSLCRNENYKKINQWYVDKYYNMFSPRERTDEYLLKYYEPAAEKTAPDESVPKETYFDELGLFFSRTGWESANSVVFAYRCGPTLGPKCQKGITSFDLGTGHVDNDINSPQIFAYGENILDEDGYGGHQTSAHNTLMVNGLGQLGDGGWSKVAPKGVDANPHILKNEEKDGMVYSVGDATEIYDAEKTGLKKFVRHFIFLKPNILIMADDIETEKREDKIPLELRFFPMSQETKYTSDGGYEFFGENIKYIIKPILAQEGVKSDFTSVSKKISDSSMVNRNAVRILSDETKLVQPTIISWSKKDDEIENVTFENKNGILVFYTDDEIITLDTKNTEVSKRDITQKIKIKTDGALINNKTEAKLIDGRIYISADDVEDITRGQVSAEITDGSVILADSHTKAITKLKSGSTEIERSGNVIETDSAPYNESGNVMIPVRAALYGFGIDCVWNGKTDTLNLISGVNFSDASLRNIDISGYTLTVEPNVYDYSIKIMAEEKQITALPNVLSAVYEVSGDDGLFGMNHITVTSQDGSTKLTYNVNIEPICGIGNVPVYNMGYSSSDGNIGENVLDGNYNTRWSAEGDGQYLWLDLGKKTKLKSMLVAFSSGDSRQGYFDIQISDDGENWKTVRECVSSGVTKEAEAYDISETESQYIRFMGHGAGAKPGAGWNSVSEIGIIAAE